MNGIDIINFARKPVSEVWFLRITTVSHNFIPLTKTAYRRITTPKDQLIDDLILMIRGRLNTFMNPSSEVNTLEEEGFKFNLVKPDGSSNDLIDWDSEGVARGVDILKGPFEWFMDGAGEENPEGTIACIITNGRNRKVFEIIPAWLPKDHQPPMSFALPTSKINHTVTLFVKCVRVKVK